MTGYLQDIVDYVAHLPALTKALVIILSMTLQYVFPIFPGDTIVIFAGFLHARGATDLLPVSISIIIGTVIGCFLGYRIGYFLFREPYRYRWIKNIATSKSFGTFNIWYQKWGSWFLLFNRFFHGIRAMFFIAAGAARLPLFRVLYLGAFSAIMFNGCLLGLGYWIGDDTDRILEFLYGFNLLAYSLIALVVGLIIIYWWRKKPRS